MPRRFLTAHHLVEGQTFRYAFLQRRLQQFGVLRAIGLGTGQLLVMAGVEYLGVVLYGLGAGTASGIAASYLFVPYLQFTGEAGRPIPPFVAHIAWREIAGIAAAFAGALILSQLVILWSATRSRLAPLLRLGQRE